MSSLSLEAHSHSTEYEHLTPPSPSTQISTLTSSSGRERKARLLYCKSHVAIHPTAFNTDNISGYLGIVEVDGNTPHTFWPDGEEDRAERKGVLVTWVPNELLERMDEEDREGFRRVDGRFGGGQTPKETEEDGELTRPDT
jgi:hypothetical protein